MAISFENALGVLPATLQFRVSRAEVIAGNISNLETSDYKAKDIDFKGVFENQLSQQGGQVNLSSGRHLKLPGGAEMQTAVYERETDKQTENGNSVELGYEQAAFMRNRMAFETSFTFLNMKLKGLETAING